MPDIKFFQVFLCLVKKVVRNGRLLLTSLPIYVYTFQLISVAVYEPIYQFLIFPAHSFRHPSFLSAKRV
nr:MAG TPA: hypothetical protein [Caudoviricetes sp.]